MSSTENTSISTKRSRSTRARRHRSQRRARKGSDSEELKESLELKKGRDANTRMYYTKVVTGAIIGFIGGIIFMLTNGDPVNPDPTGIHAVWYIFPLGGLVISMLVTRYFWKIAREEIDRKRLVLSGTFTLFAIFVFISGISWMIFTELLNPGYIMQLVNSG